MSINACGQPTAPDDETGAAMLAFQRPPGYDEQGRVRVGPGYIGADGTWPMPPGEGPCRTWPLESNCGCLSPFAEAWDANKVHAVEVATEILWRRTAGKFGLCLETVRPCRFPCPEPAPRGGVAWPDPNGTAPTPGSWFGGGSNNQLPIACGGGCGGGRTCGCGPTSEITLPGPVYWEAPERTGIPVPEDEDPWPPVVLPPNGRYRLTVWINGVQQHRNFWLADGNRLVRTDGGTWPACQDIAKPPVQDRVWIRPPTENDPGEWEWTNYDTSNTFAIQYWRGIPVPPGGRRAVSILACELYKACIGDDSCRLPRGVTEIQREGISYTLMDQQQDMLANLPDVSGWVASVNPRQMYERSTVWSPDMPRMRSDWTSGGRPNPPYTYRRDPWGWR